MLSGRYSKDLVVDNATLTALCLDLDEFDVRSELMCSLSADMNISIGFRSKCRTSSSMEASEVRSFHVVNALRRSIFERFISDVCVHF